MKAIADSILELDRPDLTPNEMIENQVRIRRCLELLWETDPLRRKKPTVFQEAVNITNVIEDMVFDPLPQFLRFVDLKLRSIGQSPLPPEHCPFKFASWAGGDRDGKSGILILAAPFLSPSRT